MRDPPASRRFPRWAHLSVRHRLMAATRLRRAPCVKGAVGTARVHPDSRRLPTARAGVASPHVLPSRPRRLPCSRSDSAALTAGRLPHHVRRRPRVRVRHAAVVADAAVYPVRRPGKYTVPPRSRAFPAALTPSAVVPRRVPLCRTCRAAVHASPFTPPTPLSTP
jgi:hypothetical protein